MGVAVVKSVLSQCVTMPVLSSGGFPGWVMTEMPFQHHKKPDLCPEGCWNVERA